MQSLMKKKLIQAVKKNKMLLLILLRACKSVFFEYVFLFVSFLCTTGSLTRCQEVVFHCPVQTFCTYTYFFAKVCFIFIDALDAVG